MSRPAVKLFMILFDRFQAAIMRLPPERAAAVSERWWKWALHGPRSVPYE